MDSQTPNTNPAPVLPTPPQMVPTPSSTQIPPSSSTVALEPIGDTIRESWEIFKKHLDILGKISGIMTVVTVIWVILTPSNPNGMSENEVAASPYVLLFAFVLIAVTFITQIMMYLFVIQRNQAWTLDSLFNAASKKAFGFAGVSLLTGLAVILGLILLVIPGIYLALALSFSVLIYLDQNASPTESLSKSRELVKGYWWQVFARYAAFVVLFIILTILVTVPFGSDTKVSGILNALVNFVILPVGTVFSVLIYEQLKKIKSGV